MAYGHNNCDDIDATLMRKSWQYFCANNMTNNILHEVTSYYPSMSGGATAKSLEGKVSGMGFTIGVSSISQWRGLARGGLGIV